MTIVRFDCAAQAPERKSKWYVPRYIPVQFAGNMGVVSTGLGYHLFKGRAHTSVQYGYVPASVSTIPVHLFSLKNAVVFPKLSLNKEKRTLPYAGFAAVLEAGGNSFLTQPTYFPKGYYVQNALHFTVFAGLKHGVYIRKERSFIRRFDLFAEAGALDYYLWYTITQREVKPSRAINFAAGINLVTSASR